MPRKRAKEDHSSFNQVIGAMVEMMNSVTKASTEEEALNAVKAVFASNPDILSNPIVQAGLSLGLAMGNRDRANHITKEEMVLLRRWRKVTQGELAQALDVSVTFISEIENGHRPIPAKYMPIIRRFFDEREPGKGSAD
jgi:DNA-binding XRE family transcriptional regulator